MKLSTLILSCTFSISSWHAIAEISCDRKSQPWLDQDCQMPNKNNPDHACRYVQYMKANSIDPKDPSLNPRFQAGNIDLTLPESYENLAYDVCKSYKNRRCAESAELLYQNHSILLEKAVVGSQIDLAPYVNGESKQELDPTLYKNFAVVSSENKNILQMMDQIIVEMKNIAIQVNDKKSLNSALEKLNNQSLIVRTKMIELSEKEDRLISIIDQTVRQIGLNSERALTHSIGFDCNFNGALSTEKYNKQIEFFISVMNDMRQEIKNAAYERKNLTNFGYLKAKYIIYASSADKANTSIDRVMDDLQKDMWLVRTMWQVADWWSSVRSNGFAGRLHTFYYYYSEPLRILRIERERALQFKTLIRSNPLYREESGSIALKSMDDKILQLEKEMVWIESKGWKDFLKLQKLSANKRAELLTDNAACQRAVKVFSNKASGIDSLSAFDENCPLYKVVVDTCVNKPNEVAR